ncbi:DUF4400 domain-containing protein [Paraburkholderia sp. CNPSo 3274]|uniref:DUF4400 domain-containing protein n=1 Tax=unclassified Paraburkholderia TaxID=2615204 RepID=UPI0020B844D5|nr:MULTISPECIES: DUF4400 domain-containing protein [unclassified Paraburkholderia]MCP3712461.1 DUF4400 domain-containing protein [Paraburkholderia sp. CNPSo 3274]MCP3718458.1 DUF4400 domain-containing protein [Paraburkholderia sp. CNPSo 3281]MCP3724623.1 DUF4400 domain-containing protein [Paraburkholderia sp. CNPSo 3272]
MASSRFVRHVKWWFFVVPLLASVLLPIIPADSLFAISDEESQSAVLALGDERASSSVDATNVLFRRLFVTTGAVQATLSGGGDGFDADGTRDFARGWARHFWMQTYRALYRAIVMKAWLAGTVVLCMAGWVDGTMRRRIRAAAAGFASPLSFHLAMHGMLVVLGCAFVVLVLPVPLIAQWWTILAIFLPLLLWIVSSSA